MINLVNFRKYFSSHIPTFSFLLVGAVLFNLFISGYIPVAVVEEAEVFELEPSVSTLLIPDLFEIGIGEKEIQGFIQSESSFLQDYSELVRGELHTAAEIIEMSAQLQHQDTINPWLLLMILEFKTGVFQDPDATVVDMQQSFGTVQEQNADVVRRYGLPQEEINEEHRNFCSSEPGSGMRISEETPLYQQMSYIACKLGFYTEWFHLKYQSEFREQYQDAGTVDVRLIFGDGSSVIVSSDLQPETYAFLKVLADLAESRTQWEQWVSDEAGSFYDLYQLWF